MCRQIVLLRGQHYEAGRIVALIHVLYIILEHVSFNIMFCIKSDVITLGGFGDIDCIYMDKWAICGHFYLCVDPVWSLYNIGTGCHEIAHVVFWVELPVQRRLCPIFIKSWVLGKGDSIEWCWVTRHPQIFRWLAGCQRTPGIWGVIAWYQSLGIRLPRARWAWV